MQPSHDPFVHGVRVYTKIRDDITKQLSIDIPRMNENELRQRLDEAMEKVKAYEKREWLYTRNAAF